MTYDLFESAASSPEQLRLVDADVLLLRSFVVEAERQRLFKNLQANSQWREEDVVIWGKRLKQPRLICWVGDEDAVYRYSGKSYTPNPWTEELRTLRDSLNSRFQVAFNSVLLNLYRNGRDSMGWHSDDEPELGSNPIIASISLGAQREFLMKHKIRKDLKIVRIPLPSGCLLLMRGDTQRYWQHSIAKEAQACDPRINLTFRTILTQSNRA